MAAIRRSASFVLIPEQSAVMYSRYEESRDAESASASPGVNSKTFISFTRMLSTSTCGAPQQSLDFFPEPHSQGSWRPVSLLIVPSGFRSVLAASNSRVRFSLWTPRSKEKSDRTLGDYGRSDKTVQFELS